MLDTRDFCTTLYDLEKEIAEEAEHAMREAVDAATDNARGTTLFKDRTMALRASIRGEARGYRGSVRAGGRPAPYGLYVHDGTKPHIIKARRAPALVFQVAGRWVRTKQVRHPGTKPRPFLVEAGNVGGEVLSDELDRRTTIAIRRTDRI